MAEKEKYVRIISWPEGPAKLEHKFKVDKPCPVSISFERSPANVLIHTTPEEPLHVDMAMNVVAKKTIPVCIKLCEPICVKSEYTIGIDIFDRPVAAITIRGQTKLFNCREQEPAKPICIDFQDLKKVGIEFTHPFVYHQLKFTPLGSQIRTVSFGDPPDQIKLAFPREGIRVDFPNSVNNVQLAVNNYAAPALDFYIYAGSNLIHQITEQVNNEMKEISIQQSDVTAIEIKGGGNEASIIRICYSLMF